VYFSAIPSEDWPRAVHAQPSSPQRRASIDANDEGSDSLGAGVDDAWMEYVHEKLRGRRPTDKDPSAKKRKMARSFCGEEGTISIGDFAQPRRR
jgi:hypothetical protein